jgi:hypothetical protein
MILAILAALFGCATLRRDETVCPEYRDIRCLAGAECSVDNPRGCRVCRCNSIDAMSQDPVAPDVRARSTPVGAPSLVVPLPQDQAGQPGK